jgi:hypothetical protein
MGFFDSLFGSTDKSTTTSVQLPAWIDKAGQNNYALAQGVAGRPYTPYTAPRIAPMSGDQTSAQEMLRGWKPKELQPGATGFSAPRMIDNITGSSPGGVSDYMSPYIDNVLDRTQSRIREATDMAKQWESNVSSHGDGAFGDARHGIADAQIERNGQQQMGDASAQAYAAAYDDAQNMRNSDINNLFRSAEFDRAGQGNVLSYIDSLYRSGSNTQNQQQQNASLMYEDFLRQLGYPQEQLNTLMSALGVAPHGETTTSTEPGPSKASSILGTGLSLASLF